MVSVVLSKSGVPIRLTDEGWAHITEEHDELTGLRSEVLQPLLNPHASLPGGRANSWHCGNSKKVNGLLSSIVN